MCRGVPRGAAAVGAAMLAPVVACDEKAVTATAEGKVKHRFSPDDAKVDAVRFAELAAEGTVAMARTDERDSAGCQSCIFLAPAQFLDGKHVLFAKVIEGTDAVGRIEPCDGVGLVRIMYSQ